MERTTNPWTIAWGKFLAAHPDRQNRDDDAYERYRDDEYEGYDEWLSGNDSDDMNPEERH